MPTVSVIMNCYNGEKYLREAIDSVYAQTFTDWEIILWDDASMDGTEKIARSYDEKLKYYRGKKAVSLGQARIWAVEKAAGEFIAFLDQDDLWLPEKLREQVNILQNNPEIGLVYGRMEIMVNDDGINTPWGQSMHSYSKICEFVSLPDGWIFKNLLQSNFIPILSVLVRRSSYDAVGGFDSNLNQVEDYDLFLKIAKDFKVYAVQKAFCIYRVHASNNTNTHLDDDLREDLAVVGRYLPLPDAKQGILNHHTRYAASMIRQGLVFEGLYHLIIYGSILLFFVRFTVFVGRRFLSLSERARAAFRSEIAS
jgi:glycosyltransferase involved in cell wall biosynthesis